MVRTFNVHQFPAWDQSFNPKPDSLTSISVTSEVQRVSDVAAQILCIAGDGNRTRIRSLEAGNKILKALELAAFSRFAEALN